MINRETRYKAVVHYRHFQRSLRQVSKIYGVSRSSLQRWVHKDPEAKRCAKRKKAMPQLLKACIEQRIKANPFINMIELAKDIQTECNIRMSSSSAGRHRRSCGITRKKPFVS